MVFTNAFKHYTNEYFAVIGLPNNHLHSTVIEIYGEPINVVQNDDSDRFFTIQYDGIEFVMTNTLSGNAFVSAVRISSPDFRFGSRAIGVGSTREEVKTAYNGRFHNIAKWLERHLFNDGRPVLNGHMFERPDGGFTIIDGITWVEFYFDEDDKVNKMVMYNNGP